MRWLTKTICSSSKPPSVKFDDPLWAHQPKSLARPRANVSSGSRVCPTWTCDVALKGNICDWLKSRRQLPTFREEAAAVGGG